MKRAIAIAALLAVLFFAALCWLPEDPPPSYPTMFSYPRAERLK